MLVRCRNDITTSSGKVIVTFHMWFLILQPQSCSRCQQQKKTKLSSMLQTTWNMLHRGRGAKDQPQKTTHNTHKIALAIKKKKTLFNIQFSLFSSTSQHFIGCSLKRQFHLISPRLTERERDWALCLIWQKFPFIHSLLWSALKFSDSLRRVCHRYAFWVCS